MDEATGQLTPLDAGTVHTLVIPNAPEAAEDLELRLEAHGQVGGPFNTVDLRLNGFHLADAFAAATPTCDGAVLDTRVIRADVFNFLMQITPGVDATFSMAPAEGVSGAACDGDTWISLEVVYSATPDTDRDGDGIPDICVCLGDVNLDREVGIGDFLSLLGAWGLCDQPCREDLNVDKVVGIDDMMMMLSEFGPCQ